jgi:putative transposase
MNVCESLNHTKWECKYHVVFIPEYRRKVLFGKWRPHLGKMFRELARQQECEIEEGHLMVDHVHRLMTIPPKYAVSQVVGYLKGKSAIHRALDEGGKCGFGLALGVVAQELLVGLIVHSLDSTRHKRNPTEIVAASFPELYAPTDEKPQRMRERSIPHFAKYGIPASRLVTAPRPNDSLP